MLPYLNVIPTLEEHVDAFGGYNHNQRIGEGEFYDMENLASDAYPLATVRKKRCRYDLPNTVTGIVGKDSFCYADGSDFVVGEERIPLDLADGEKTLISHGAYVIIMPDKKYVNTADLIDCGDIEAAFTYTGEVGYTVCRENGDAFEKFFMSSDKLANGANDAYWLDVSSEPYAVRQYAASTGFWSEVKLSTRIEAPGIDAAFNVGDSVVIRGFSSAELEDDERKVVIMAKGDGYIAVSGLTDRVLTALSKCNDDIADPDGDGITLPVKPAVATETLSVCREMPAMDYIVSSGNRLWGCRYGMSNDGKFVNEIYASAQGDFKNWNSFLGISTDSWAASRGSDGQYTGAVTFGKYPIFFKENLLVMVSGDEPSEYSINEVSTNGVANGSSRSLCMVGSVLYYHGTDGIYAYDGSLPICISAAFGRDLYKNAVAGVYDNKYYVSMKRMQSGEPVTLVYDSQKQLWHRESAIDAVMYASHDGMLYYLTESGKVGAVGETELPYDEARVKWWAVSGIIGVTRPSAVYISRLAVRIKIAPGADVRFLIEYDSSGVFEFAGACKGNGHGVFAYPILPRRCDHMRLKIEGEGEAEIFSITRTMTRGSDKR